MANDVDCLFGSVVSCKLASMQEQLCSNPACAQQCECQVIMCAAATTLGSVSEFMHE